MGGNIGLTIGINADPAEAEKALNDFRKSLGTFFENTPKQVEPLNDSLLSSKESVRLLGEEFGIHLPRAISGAISEALPEVESLGGALLAVFAVEEIWKWGKAAVEAIREAQGETKELKSMMDDIIADQEKILRNPENLTQARSDLAETEKRLGAVGGKIGELEKKLTETPKAAAEAVLSAAGAWSAPMMAQAAATTASVDQITSQLQELNAERDKLEERQRAQLEVTTRLEKDDARDRAEAEKRSYRESLAAARNYWEAVKQQHELVYKIRAEAGREIAQERAAAAQDAEDKKFALEVDMQILDVIEQQSNWADRQVKRMRELGPAIIEGPMASARQIEVVYKELLRLQPQLSKEEALAQAQRLAANPAIQAEIANLGRLKSAHDQLIQSLREELGIGSQYLGLMDSLTEAAHEQADAVGKDMFAAVAGLSEGIAGLIGGRRAQAAVEAAFEVAQGVKQIAMALDPYDPMHAQHALSAAQHFVAAAEYGKVAGTGSGHHGGSGSGGGSGGSSAVGPAGSPSFGRQGVQRNGGSPNGGAKSGSGQTIVQISGGKLNSNGQQQLAAWVGMGSAVGLFKLNSSGSSGIQASRY